MSTILNTIINLKNTLVNLSGNNWDRLNALNGDLQIGDSITIPTGRGMYGVFTKTANECVVKIKDKVGNQIGNTLRGLNFDDIITNDTIFSDVVLSEYTNVNELVSDAASDAQIYDALAIVTDGYKVNTRQSVDAITTSLSGYINDNPQYQEMMSDVASLADDNGLISNTAWLTFIQSICNRAKQNLGSSGFLLDTSAPEYISCLWTTIAAEALPLIGELIQWIASCIGGIIGIVGIAVGAVLSFLGRLFGQVIRPGYSVVDADANTPLLKEVPFAMTPPKLHTAHPDGGLLVLEDDFAQVGQVIKYDRGFIEHYVWPNSVIYRENHQRVLKPLLTDINFNSFLSFKLNPIKTINWIYNNLITVVKTETGVYGFKFRNNINNFWTIPTECEWSLTELMMMQQGDSDMIQASAWCCLLCLSLSLLNVADYWDDYKYIEENDNILVSLDDYMNLTGLTKSYYERAIVACGVSTIQYLYRKCSRSGSDIISASFDSLEGVYPNGSNFPTHTCTTLTSLIFVLNERSLIYSNVRTRPDFEDIFQATGNYNANPQDYPNLPRFSLNSFYWNPAWNFFTAGAPRYEEWNEYYYQEGEAVFLRPKDSYSNIRSVDDYIPQTRAFRCENTSWAEVIWTIVATATLVVAGIVAGTIVKSKLKKRKLKRKMDATKAMNAATDKYNKGQIDYDTYYKQLKAYNRKARWFGYPSYDPCNKWFDYGSAADTQSNSLDISKITNLINGK